MAKVCQNKDTYNILVPNRAGALDVQTKSLGIPLEWAFQPRALWLSRCRCLIVPVSISLRHSLEHPDSLYKKILKGCHPPWTKYKLFNLLFSVPCGLLQCISNDEPQQSKVSIMIQNSQRIPVVSHNWPKCQSWSRIVQKCRSWTTISQQC